MAPPNAKTQKALQSPKTAAAKPNPWEQVFPFVAGLWLALVFTKFGTPVIFEDRITTPSDALQLAMDPWPFSWGYLFLGILILFALPIWRWKSAAPKWVLVLPLVWFGWQLISGTQTVDGTLTQRTLLDFAACILCFYVGLFSLSRLPNRAPLWCGLLLGLLFALWTGLGQHFGGLEETRRAGEHIRWELYPPEFKIKFQQKMASERIFGTFFYPNALAGGIILALPASLLALWTWCGRFSFVIRGVLTGTFLYMSLACLFWSGSKAGWLIMLGMGLVALFHLPHLGPRQKTWALVIVLLAGSVAFLIKNSGYFAKKTNSATARLDYWKAAGQMLQQKPLLGWGPGTFTIGYQRLKRPEAEPTKLAHNDYLQQGSDSGLVGLCSYLVLVVGSVVSLYGRAKLAKGTVLDLAGKTPSGTRTIHWIPLAVWLGLAGLAAQEFVEFSLYIPALAWPFFLLLGWLWGVVGNKPTSTPAQQLSSRALPPLVC